MISEEWDRKIASQYPHLLAVHNVQKLLIVLGYALVLVAVVWT